MPTRVHHTVVRGENRQDLTPYMSRTLTANGPSLKRGLFLLVLEFLFLFSSEIDFFFENLVANSNLYHMMGT